jgi:hypothetical protein
MFTSIPAATKKYMPKQTDLSDPISFRMLNHRLKQLNQEAKKQRRTRTSMLEVLVYEGLDRLRRETETAK